MNIGTSVGPYKILRHLGTGGMGEVWLAEDTRLHRQVALKMVRGADTAGEASRTRMMREARAAAALNHPHIATVHDVIEAREQVVIVFEYVEGETLHDRIQRGVVPVPAAVDIAIQIARALVAAHAHGVVHRDLKPANVIIGAGGHVKVLDFGIARMVAIGTTETSGSLPQSSAIGFVGTAGYAAPEQMVSGAVDERADLYALGVVLFEMLSGRRPFPGNDPLELATSKLSQDAPLLSSTGQLVPPALERFVATLLARDRADRPASAADALAELRGIYGTPSTGAMNTARTRSFWTSVAAVAIIAALAGFGAWELNRFVRPVAIDPSRPPVIAVLPLSNVSGDPSRDYVAAGIAESLISSLASLPSVTVLSRSSVTEARSRTQDEAALARDLGATYIVNGSVQEANGALKISLNLVKPDRTIAWGHTVDGAFERIFDLQTQLANALTSALVVRVSASERERMNASSTDNPDALSAYWQGRALLERSDVKGNTEAAITAFERAIRLDSRFALAHAALSQSYRRKYNETREPRWAEQAINSANTALRLDPNRAEVRFVLALTLESRGRLDEAADELNRALALQPNYEEARRQLGQVLAAQGNIDAAVLEFRKAIALRPDAANAYSQMGLALLRAARYREAADVFEEAVRVAPDNYSYYQQLGTAYQFLGDNDRALENYRRTNAIRPSAPAYSNIGALLHQRGDFAGAVDAYRQAIAIRPNSANTHRNLGDALARMGRREDARASYLEAMRLFEIDLQVNPHDARATALLGVVAQKAGRTDIARGLVAAALKRAQSNPDVLYSAATVAALSGDRDTALERLAAAISRGYSKAQAAEDEDLASIRDTAQFRSLMQPDNKEKPR